MCLCVPCVCVCMCVCRDELIEKRDEFESLLRGAELKMPARRMLQVRCLCFPGYAGYARFTAWLERS